MPETDNELRDESFTFGNHSVTVSCRRTTQRTSNFRLTVQVSRKELFNSLQDFGGAPWSSSSDDEDAPPTDIDALGLDVWPASITLCEHIAGLAAADPESFRSKRVIELGAGVGLPGLIAAKVGAAESVISDYDAAVVAHAAEQVARCGLGDVARAAIIDWKMPVGDEFRERFDWVMAADVLYMSFLVPDLLRWCRACVSKPNGRVLLTHQCRQSLVEEGGEIKVVDRDVSFEAFKEAVERQGEWRMRVIAELPSKGFPGPMNVIELAPL